MCGIIAVLRRRSRRQPPAADAVRRDIDAAAGMLPDTLEELSNLSVLEEAGWCRVVERQQGRGRPAEIVLLNPALGGATS